MIFLVLNKETDELVEVLKDPTKEYLEKYTEEHPNVYIRDENYLIDKQFYEDGIDYNDLW
jgi:hypothetical protein